MIINSRASPVYQLPGNWAEGIPVDADLTFTVMTDVTGGETRLYPSTNFRDGFIYYQPDEESIADLLTETALPMTALIDDIYRQDHAVSPEWVVEHYITTRRGGGNISVSLQRELLRIAAKHDLILRPNTVRRSAVHRDHSDGNDDWVFYGVVGGKPTHVLEGNLVSVLDSIDKYADVNEKLAEWANSLNPSIARHVDIKTLSKWLFTSIRLGRSALFRTQALQPSVEDREVEPDILHQMDGETVHYRPSFRLSQNRVFYRDVLTKLINKSVDKNRYERMISNLRPAGNINIVEGEVLL